MVLLEVFEQEGVSDRWDYTEDVGLYTPMAYRVYHVLDTETGYLLLFVGISVYMLVVVVVVVLYGLLVLFVGFVVVFVVLYYTIYAGCCV